MDFAKTHERKTLTKESYLISISLFAVFIFAFIAIIVICLVPFSNNTDSSDAGSQASQIVEDEPVDEIEPDEKEIITPVNFQSVVDGWVNNTSGNKSVLIYDLERDEIVGSYNPSENYNTASLYKLFVVYVGYLKINSGEWNRDDPAGRTGYSIIQCLDLAIRESNSVCAESLWSMIGRDNLQNIIVSQFGITDSNINSLISNPNDILKIMKIYYHHDGITDESLIGLIKDSFLNQPVTTYNWRQGFPSGFSKANIYNKVGWDYNPDKKIWNIYHDAAIVEYPDANRHFVMIVMSNYVPYQKIRDLGSMLETHFYNQ
ncbi:serine hydrolase [Candidatus Saccharibacteria bacterium]|nr:serine hydrolase [Candidatus Saccharibacteria bacterium]